MMISSKGRYALRVMLDMAQRHQDGYIRLHEIAERQQISRKYLESIMTVLCKHHLVESTVGKAGGYRLLRPPEGYAVGEILRAVEGDLAPVSCVAGEGKKCSGSCGCDTLPFWQGLERQINTYMNSYTLADLLNAERKTPGCPCGAGTEDKEG